MRIFSRYLVNFHLRSQVQFCTPRWDAPSLRRLSLPMYVMQLPMYVIPASAPPPTGWSLLHPRRTGSSVCLPACLPARTRAMAAYMYRECRLLIDFTPSTAASYPVPASPRQAPHSRWPADRSSSSTYHSVAWGGVRRAPALGAGRIRPGTATRDRCVHHGWHRGGRQLPVPSPMMAGFISEKLTTSTPRRTRNW